MKHILTVPMCQKILIVIETEASEIPNFQTGHPVQTLLLLWKRYNECGTTNFRQKYVASMIHIVQEFLCDFHNSYVSILRLFGLKINGFEI